jgi:N-acetylmuramoyl-L-alanine amidase
MFIGLEKGKGRLKKVILREIYEQNLKIAGKHSNNRVNIRIRTLLIKSVLSILTIIFIIIGSSNYLNLAIIQNYQLNSDIYKIRVKDKYIRFNPKDREVFNVLEYSNFFDNSNPPLSKLFGLEVKTIIIDPGHGGEDSGAIGKKGTMEKDITLDIAKRLRDRLSRYRNYQIFMTREEDITLPLNKRVEFANSAKADLFISIHVNYLPHKPINIIETYYFGPYSDNKTLKLTERENKGSQYRLVDFKDIIQNIGNTMKLQESKMLANLIQKSLFENIRRQGRDVIDFGIKRAPFVVLLGVDMPSVLTEVSCLSNREEENKLNTKEYRKKIASYLEEGIVKYLNKNNSKGDKNYEAREIKSEK